jgi:hypothetical protein
MRVVVINAVAAALAATPAAGQAVTFSTSGAFTGSQCAPSFCAFGGFTLQWTGVNGAAWLPPADIVLGSFKVNCISVSCGSESILGGTTFMLTISQSGPTPGSGSFNGTLSGFLGWDPSSSNLFWTPNQGSVTIGGVTYGLDQTDVGCPVANTQCIKLNAPSPDQNPSFTEVHDDVTSTPEPATLGLMATGFLGLIPLARRRHRK